MDNTEFTKLTRALWALTITMIIVAVIEFGFLFSLTSDLGSYLNPTEPYETLEELYLTANYDELKEKANARIESHPNEEYSYYYLAKMYFRAKEWSLTKQYFEKTLAVDPDWSGVQGEIVYICEQIECT